MQINLSALEGKSVLITGATGLVGKSLVRKLISWNATAMEKIQIIALVRSRVRANVIFTLEELEEISIWEGNVCDLNGDCPWKIDYVIHAASQTSSREFIDRPVETICIALWGTRNMLELARKQQVQGFVYLSTMEVYGTPDTDEKISERHSSNLDTMSVRSCYPESKRMCENLCACYSSEYGVPAMVLRLTQTFGEGVDYHDGRVFAEFSRCVIEGRDIILKTKGQTKRSYLHVKDAANAILTVLLKGEPGTAYNAANEETYCSIYEMAQLAASMSTDDKIQVQICEEDTTAAGYAPMLKMNLDTQKLRALDWSPAYSLSDMFHAMIQDMKENVKNKETESNE